MNEYCCYDKFFNTVASTTALPTTYYILPNYSIDFTYSNFIEEKNMMTLFNWFLVSKYEEGKEPEKSGFITSSDEESAREFIVRSFDNELFARYKDDEFALVVTEVDSWEI